MRKIVMFNRVSADGCFAAADGNLDWVVPDAQVDKLGAAGIPGTDTVIMGRRTYERFASFWPHVLDSPAPVAPHGAGRFSPEMHAFARALNDMTKLVFSKTLAQATWSNTRLQRDFDPRAIADMKRQPGKDMIIFGSGSIVAQLTRHGLVDEYQLVVTPVLLGGGKPLLAESIGAARLELLDAKPFASGNVILRYARAG
jgi:dihydrofolate reductase